MAESSLMCLSLLVFVLIGFVSSQGMNFSITDDSTQNVQVDLSGRECIMFQMKTCNTDNSVGTAVIYLTSQATNMYTNYVYAIPMKKESNCLIIQTSDNLNAPHSILWDCRGFTLSCSELNWYWISWGGGSISIGMGEQPGVNSLLTFYDDSISQSTIRYMGVNNWVGMAVYINLPAVLYSQDDSYCNFPVSINGSAETCVGQAKEFKFASTRYSYVTTDMDISKRNWIVFQVQATSDVHVALLSDTNNIPQYQFIYKHQVNMMFFNIIIIGGGDGITNIVRGGASANLLNPSALEWYWMAWDKGTVMTGKGEMLGQNTVMSFSDVSPQSTDKITQVQIACGSATPCTMRFPSCYFLSVGCSPLIKRSEWKSKTAAPSTPLLTLPVKKIIVHVTLTTECFTPAQCLKQVKAIETYQQQQHITKLDGIAYSYLIGEDGRVYEGTGQHVGNHTNGHNGDSYGIAFIGEFNSRLPIDRALKAFQQLLSTSCVMDLGLGKNFTIALHYDVDCTMCPNGPLRKWIKKTYSNNYVASSYNCRRGGYVHPVKK